MKKNYIRLFLYSILMFFFLILSYFFIYNAVVTKNKIYINYTDKSETFYEVVSIDSNKEMSVNNIDDIKINFNYNNIFSENTSGYYKYNVILNVYGYEDNINNSFNLKEDIIFEDKTSLIDENNVNSIFITDNFIVDYSKYREFFNKFINDYNVNALGYIKIKIKILEYLNFEKIDDIYSYENEIVINIPLGENEFKVDVYNIDNSDNFGSFSNRGDVNNFQLFIGIVCLSLGLSFMVMIIRCFILVYRKQSRYMKEYKFILDNYNDKLVKINRIYNYSDYNLIYVDNFSDLLDVCIKTNSLINYKEVKHASYAIFLVNDKDNIWLYKLY